VPGSELRGNGEAVRIGASEWRRTEMEKRRFASAMSWSGRASMGQEAEAKSQAMPRTSQVQIAGEAQCFERRGKGRAGPRCGNEQICRAADRPSAVMEGRRGEWNSVAEELSRIARRGTAQQWRGQAPLCSG
jgi:hypothetical protein